MLPPDEITCPDCGGKAGLLSFLPEDELEPGMPVAYRCGECGDRFDLVLEDPVVDDEVG